MRPARRRRICTGHVPQPVALQDVQLLDVGGRGDVLGVHLVVNRREHAARLPAGVGELLRSPYGLLHRVQAHPQPRADQPKRDIERAHPGDFGIADAHGFGVDPAPVVGVFREIYCIAVR
jgi:hypothetical protein